MAFGVFGQVRSVALQANGVFMIHGCFLDTFEGDHGFRKAKRQCSNRDGQELILCSQRYTSVLLFVRDMQLRGLSSIHVHCFYRLVC